MQSNWQEEFERYTRQVKENGGVVASKRHLDKKIIDIQELRNYKLTDVCAVRGRD